MDSRPLLASHRSSDGGQEDESDLTLVDSPRLGEYAIYDTEKQQQPRAGGILPHRRSKTRLVVLVVLGIGVLVGISAWQAPDHVKTVVAAGQGKATEIWQQAKQATDNIHWWWEDGEDGDDNEEEEEEEALPTSYEPLQWNEIQPITQVEQDDVLAPIETQSLSVQVEVATPTAKTAVQEWFEDETGELTTTTQETQATTTRLAVETQSSKEKPVETPATEAFIDGPHPVYVLPVPTRLPKGGPDEKFLAYLPHSGYHNQRIELVNALTLAAALGRTLLLPPVWLGWPQTTQPYKQLQATWEKQTNLHRNAFIPLEHHHRLAKRQAKKLTAEDCKSYAKECASTYTNTFLSWGFLTQISRVEERVPLVDRFNMTEAYAKELAGVESDDDFYLLQDYDKYYFHFHDRDSPREPDMVTKLPDGNRYNYTVSIPKLAEFTQDKKLLIVGSMFGGGRMYMQEKRNQQNYRFFERALAFSNPLLDPPADQIRDLMGGSEGYIGVHARVGDGYFLMQAKESMEKAFVNLLETLGVPRRTYPTLIARGKERMNKLEAEANATAPSPRRRETRRSSHNRRLNSHAVLRKRQDEFYSEDGPDDTDSDNMRELFSAWSIPDDAYDPDDAPLFDEELLLRKRQSHVLGPVRSREDMPLSKTLTCRGPLHTDRNLLVLNNPVYIATDSRSPLTEPSLSFFMANFPCVFILSDFDRPSAYNSGEQVHSLKTMAGAYNENDNVNLGRLFLPFMEAMVAAKGAETVGTAGSTFSGFASGPLHEAYHAIAH